MQDILIKKTIRPLIKWTGGKYEEFPKFAVHIPPFEQYFEPFFGGGGVFFALQPAGQSFVNDRSSDLITFYRSLTDPAFRQEMYSLVEAWEGLRVLYEDFAAFIRSDFTHFLSDALTQDTLYHQIDQYFESPTCHAILQDLRVFKTIEFAEILGFLQHSTKDKFRRIKRITDREQRVFGGNELDEHIETALRSGFYLYIRRLMNDSKARSLAPATQTAVWYFVREFCYASMFRFNAKGEFNIPYGGIAYNRKNLRTKVDALFVPELQELFTNCKLHNLDFEVFLEQNRPQKNDFIFLDPPYDSEFSEYDQNSFTQADQLRLRDCLAQQEASWMMVIKETPFIRRIYEEIDAYFIDFDKTYLYNVRGRNNRETKHLIITNYNATDR